MSENYQNESITIQDNILTFSSNDILLHCEKGENEKLYIG